MLFKSKYFETLLSECTAQTDCPENYECDANVCVCPSPMVLDGNKCVGM